MAPRWRPNTDTYATRLRPPLYRRRWFQVVLAGTCIAFVAGLIGTYAFLKPHKDRADRFDLTEIGHLEVPSRIYDRHGREIGQIKIEDRRPVGLDQVPYHVVQALTAVEDSRFFEHDGVDYIGIVRAAILNLKAGRVTQGASTITQQLAKQCYEELRLQRNLDTKITEAFLARRLEKEFSKPEILELYLNRVFFGSGYFGIDSASRGYFGKPVGEIDVVEAATLCGLIKSPTRLSPKNNPRESRTARNHVLARMHIEGMITDAELAEYRARPIELAEAQAQQNSYVNEIIRLRVISQLGFEKAAGGGFKIYTTIDRDVQAAARQSLLRNLSKAESHPQYKHRTYAEYQETARARDPLGGASPKPKAPDYLQGAVLMIENDSGGVVALVGGRSFQDNQFNYAFHARCSPGTAFTPLVYAAAFSGDDFPGSIVKDAPIDNRSVAIGGSTGILGEWGNESADVTYLGDIPAREALVQSKNAATVRLGKKVGRRKVMDLAKRAGIESPMDDYDRCLLGSSTLELDEFCMAFTMFPNGGTRPDKLHLISSVTDAAGKVIYTEPESKQVRVIDGIAAYQTHSCLAEALERGTGKGAAGSYGLRDRNAAGKTGTAYNFTDLWFVGYNDKLTCGVWAGFDTTDTIYHGAFSNTTVLPVWVDAMNASAAAFPSQPIPLPEGARTVEICKKSGRRATDACYEELPGSEDGERKIERSTYREIIRAGTDFHLYCDYHSGGEGTPRPILPQIASSGPAPPPIQTGAPADAILVQSPTVIGADDPYNSIQPVLRARPANAEDEVRRATPVSPISLGNSKPPIEIEQPEPLVIPEVD